jgi:hypothetical protein
MVNLGGREASRRYEHPFQILFIVGALDTHKFSLRKQSILERYCIFGGPDHHGFRNPDTVWLSLASDAPIILERFLDLKDEPLARV